MAELFVTLRILKAKAMNEQLSEFLTLRAATMSATALKYGINNTPGPAEIRALRLWGENIYDRVCREFGFTYGSSIYRCLLLNAHPSIGGSRTSGHVKGEAGDLDGDAPNSRYVTIDNVELFEFVRKSLKFDQLIAEFEANGAPRWCHTSYRQNNRGQVLIATKNRLQQTVYLPYTASLFNQIYKRSRGASFFMPEFVMPEIDFHTGEDEGCTGDIEQEVLATRSLDLQLDVPAPSVPLSAISAPEDTQSEVAINFNPEPPPNPIVLSTGGIKVTITVEADKG